MQTSIQAATVSIPPPAGQQRRSRQTEDIVYQGVTMAVILLLLSCLF